MKIFIAKEYKLILAHCLLIALRCFLSIIVQSNFVSVTKHLVGPSSNGTDAKMVKEIEFHVTEKFVQVIV